jgi:TP901 family phage tail tape measure protein
MATSKDYRQLIKLGIDYDEAISDFKKFRTLLKSNVEDSLKTTFTKLGNDARKSVDKIFSGLSAKRLQSKPFLEFFKDIDNQIESTAKAINDDFLKSVVNLNKEFRYGRKNPSGYTKELLKLVEAANEVSKGSSAKLGEKIKKDAEAFLKAYKEAHKFSLAISAVASRMKSFLVYFAASKIVYGIVNTFTAATKAAIDLETEFANIQAITSATDADMEKLRDTILRVGESSKYTTEEIAKSTVMLGQAGLSAEEIDNVLETTTQLAAATGSELSNTVDLMTSALAVWGLNSEEASHLSDVMVTGMNKSKATLDTFRMAVQYAGATAASLNVSFEEMAAVSSAAANAGLRASVVGTGLRATMAELISPTTKMVKGLKALGLNTEDVDIASRGLVPVLKSLRDAGLNASNAYDLFGRRAATFVLAAQGQLDKIDELQIAFMEQGATLKAYNKQMNTVSAQTTALGNTIKAICSDILDSISGMIVGFLKGVNKALQWVRKLFGDEDIVNFKESE